MSRKKKRRVPPTPGPTLDLPLQELAQIIERTQTGPLSVEEYGKLKALVDTLAFLRAEVQAKNSSIKRLLGMLFGSSTEKTQKVLPPASVSGQASPAEGIVQGAQPGQQSESPRPKPPGHGRHAAAAYTGAERVKVPHPQLRSGDPCPQCPAHPQGKVYPFGEPSPLVRITGMAPLSATVYECERLRCNLCGEVYTAAAPAGVGEQKYDAGACAMIALLTYRAGVPFYRLEKLQNALHIPLPASTQWDLVRESAATVTPVREVMIDQAANGQLIHNDDTTQQVLQLTREQRAVILGEEAGERTGVFTSGILAVNGGHQIALFFSGVRHAGENLTEVLRRRSQELPPPIQMCDGLESNLAKSFKTLLCRCTAHARRKYVEVADNFPGQVHFVLETLSKVYEIDDRAREQGLSAQERLGLHQEHSKPLMEGLNLWMRQQFEQRLVEPNSGLGKAIRHMQKHWDALTRFLHVENAPLDNNVCERALKMAIIRRKNSMFYRTLNGAHVGDTFMTLIHTAELAGANTFEYLVALLQHPDEIAQNPDEWMPWNYQATLAALTAGTGPPA
jgi:transposase